MANGKAKIKQENETLASAEKVTNTKKPKKSVSRARTGAVFT